MNRVKAFPALLLAAGLATLGRPTFAQRASDDADRPEVRELRLEGVRAVDKQDLEESIATSASKCRGLFQRAFCLVSHASRWWDKAFLDRTEMRRDVLRIRVFYWLRGFREAQVDTSITRVADGAVRVTFRVSEGEPTRVRALRVTRPESVLDDDAVAKTMQLAAGQPFSLIALDSSVVLLRGSLHERGYADARLDTASVVDDSARLADVTITIDPRWQARVGEIRVTGNQDVSTRTILTSLSFKSGEIYRRSELTRSQRRLWETGMFRRAAITLPTRGDSVKVVDVSVSEAPLNLARTSGGFNTIDYLQVDGRYTRYNFFGGARRLDLRGAAGNLLASSLNGRGIFRQMPIAGIDGGEAFLHPTWQAGADFLQPWFLSPHNSVSLGLFSHRQSAPSVFIDRGFGGNATVTREVSFRLPVSLNYRFEVTKVEAGDVYYCINFGVCDPSTISALRGNQRLSPIALTATANRSNDVLEPTSGYLAEAAIEHASAFTISNFRYNRVLAEASVYRPVRRTWTLAAHARVGWVRSLASTSAAVGVDVDPATGLTATRVLHPRTRFYAGGSRSVRGVGENELGPRVLTLPPSKLTFCSADSSRGPTAVELESCDLAAAQARDAIKDRDFTTRPLGGNTVLEGSVELRVPLFEKLSGAVFLDGAIVGQGSLREAAQGAGVLTPGFGIRYRSPVGPIRVDFGFNPSLAEDLPVITQADDAGSRRIVVVRNNGQASTWRYDPTRARGGIFGVLDRFTLHLSIGQAY
jgi:translocation and assembly module TamA